MTQEPQPTPELLPCPFCGGKPWIFEDHPDHSRWVTCETCECDGPIMADGQPTVKRQQVVDAWNQRQPTPRTLTPEQVERAKTLVGEASKRWTDMAWIEEASHLLREVVGE